MNIYALLQLAREHALPALQIGCSQKMSKIGRGLSPIVVVSLQTAERTEGLGQVCIGGCGGLGQQGGTAYHQTGLGCCAIGGSAGLARKEYQERECGSVTISVPTPFGLGAYLSFGIKDSGGLNWGDWSGGATVGEGAGVDRVQNHDLNSTDGERVCSLGG